ncbi:hypothetical protein JCM33374_g2726 [Metschnikowia sp. JCM 33374]|nr:hypothetical protein JCM33374_g2726 [Metschnikowia sp. JCM 33374]
MALSEEKEKRPRSRAPVSCLNCKRRKVRCDKGRPCSGCVRNNVGHLCVYVEPKWAEQSKLAAKSARSAGPVGLGPGLDSSPRAGPGIGPGMSPGIGSPNNTSDLSALRMEMQSKIDAQANEIKCLRARLAQQVPMPQPPQPLNPSNLHSSGPYLDSLPMTTNHGSPLRTTSQPNKKQSQCPFHRPLPHSTDLTRFMREISAGKIPVTILDKLTGKSRSEKGPAVTSGSFFCMSGFRQQSDPSKESLPTITALYSWLNIIKVDPQLTALWFRITNLQKSYHLYKTSLLKRTSRAEIASVSGPGPMMSRSQSAESAASSDTSARNHKCPVVACEFNLMLEEANTDADTTSVAQIQARTNTLAGIPSDSLCPIKFEGKGSLSRIRPETNSHGEDALGMLTSLQALWREIVGSSRTSENLNYAQLRFLVDLYIEGSHGCKDTVGYNFKSEDSPNNIDFDSRHLLRFFRSEILALFTQDGASVRLDVGSFSPAMSDAEVVGLLNLKAIYMIMLAVIVDETVDVLHSDAEYDGITATAFRSWFPMAKKPGLGDVSKTSDVLVHVVDLAHSLFKPQGPMEDIDSSMSAISMLVTVLNRLGVLYERKNLSIDVRDAYSRTFVLLFETIHKEGQVLQLWRDPSQVTLKGVGISADQKIRLGLLICQLWHDFLRLTNNVTFNTLPFVKHITHIDALLGSVLVRVPEIDTSNVHANYLAKIQDKHMIQYVEMLSISIQAQHLIARSSVVLRNCIQGHCTNGNMAISDFSSLINEISDCCENNNLVKLRTVRSFEVRMILHYLCFFFSTVVFLQLEETGDRDAVSQLMPLLLQKFLDVNNFMQDSSLKFTKDTNAQYVWAVVAETFARISHIISGLLIRFKPESKAAESKSPKKASVSTNVSVDLLVYTSRTNEHGAIATITMPVSKKEEIIYQADRTVDVLESMMGRETSGKRTKIWKFYQTFIRNSHKMNPAGYAKLHAEALGAGRLLDKCPIMSSSGYETSATRMELSKCPVARISSPVLSKPQGVKVEESLGELRGARSINGTGPPQTGKCPFGHDSRDNLGSTVPPISVSENGDSRKRRWSYDLEQNSSEDTRRDTQPSFLGRIAKYTPPLCVPTASPMPPPAPVIPPPQIPDPFTEAPFGDMDWDSLPNFNFDMMEDEALMGQLNGGDFNNPILESLFQ